MRGVTTIDRGIFQMARFLVQGTPRDRWVGDFLFRLLPLKGGAQTQMSLTPDHGEPYDATSATGRKLPAYEDDARLDEPGEPGDLGGYSAFKYQFARMRLPRS
jgi:hypothetical protein